MKNSITQLSFCSHPFSSPMALSQVFTSLHVHDLMEGWGEASTTSSTAATIQIVKIDQFRDINKIKSGLKTRGVAAKRGRKSETTLCGAGRVVMIRSRKSCPVLHSHGSYTSSQIFFRPALPLINKYITVTPQIGGVGSPPSPTTNSTCARQKSKFWRVLYYSRKANILPPPTCYVQYTSPYPTNCRTIICHIEQKNIPTIFLLTYNWLIALLPP